LAPEGDDSFIDLLDDGQGKAGRTYQDIVDFFYFCNLKE